MYHNLCFLFVVVTNTSSSLERRTEEGTIYKLLTSVLRIIELSTVGLIIKSNESRVIFSRLKPNPIVHNSGEIENRYTPLVTGKGQKYFVNKFFNEKVLEA